MSESERSTAAIVDGGRVPEAEWEWFGAAGHFICSAWCRFHLCTKVGRWLVSTVGEYWPERPVREIHAKVHDPDWLAQNRQRKGDDFDAAYMRRFGFEEIGYSRLYETMVFEAGQPCASRKCGCGLPQLASSELDFEGYMTAAAATKGHLAMCQRWAARATLYAIEEVRPEQRHGLAALCLDDQPFGFRWEDVELLRKARDAGRIGGTHREIRYAGPPLTFGEAGRLAELADRIEALLRPRKEGE